MGNSRTEGLVAHHQDLKLLEVVDQELLEASWQHMFGLIVANIPDVGHQHLSLESPADLLTVHLGLCQLSAVLKYCISFIFLCAKKKGVQAKPSFFPSSNNI